MMTWTILGCYAIGEGQHRLRVEEIVAQQTDDTLTVVDDFELGDKIATELRLLALVAWSADRGTVVDPVISGDPGFQSAVAIRLSETNGYQVDGRWCKVTIPLAGQHQSPTALERGFDWGLSLPEGPKLGTWSNCLEMGFDPAQFPNGDPLTLADSAWEIYMRGGPLDAELVSHLEGVGAFDGVLDTEHFAGARLIGPERFGSFDHENYWFGYTMNEFGDTDLDRHVSFDEVLAGPGQLETGYYVLEQTIYWLLDP